MAVMIKWLKALLPLSVLALSLALIFFAFKDAGGSYPGSHGIGATVPGCFGDRDCEREYRQAREDQRP